MTVERHGSFRYYDLRGQKLGVDRRRHLNRGDDLLRRLPIQHVADARHAHNIPARDAVEPGYCSPKALGGDVAPDLRP